MEKPGCGSRVLSTLWLWVSHTTSVTTCDMSRKSLAFQSPGGFRCWAGGSGRRGSTSPGSVGLGDIPEPHGLLVFLVSAPLIPFSEQALSTYCVSGAAVPGSQGTNSLSLLSGADVPVSEGITASHPIPNVS